MRSEGFYINEKFQLTPTGIDPATFLFVAQHINHCATAVFIDIRDRLFCSGKELDPSFNANSGVLFLGISLFYATQKFIIALTKTHQRTQFAAAYISRSQPHVSRT